MSRAKNLANLIGGASAGTSGMALPSGTTAQRPSSAAAGTIRNNTSSGLLEFYTGTEWKPVGSVYDTATDSTGYFDLPSGTTAQRPASPNSGMVRFNTTLNQAEIYNAADNAWVPFNVPKGTISNPIRSNSDATTLSTGSVYVLPNGYSGSAFQTYLDNTNLGGGWLLAFVVTNANGSEVDWWAGDSSFAGYTGTDYFSTLNSTLNVSGMSSLIKQNSKNPLMDYWSTNNIMIREDYQGTIGYKGYILTSTKTFYARFTDGSNPIDSDQSYTNQVSSIIGTVGTMGATFTTNTLDFNYTLNNDGARIAATPVSAEATGGISARVDISRNYSWKGNLTRSDAGRAYGSSGVTTDHTVWIFVR